MCLVSMCALWCWRRAPVKFEELSVFFFLIWEALCFAKQKQTEKRKQQIKPKTTDQKKTPQNIKAFESLCLPEKQSLAGLVFFIHPAHGHGRPCRAGDVFQSKHEKTETCYPHLIIAVKVIGRDNSVEILF